MRTIPIFYRGTYPVSHKKSLYLDSRSADFALKVYDQAEFFSGEGLRHLLTNVADSPYFLLWSAQGFPDFVPYALNRLIQVADDSGAGLVYSDFKEQMLQEKGSRPLLDYQLGSVRTISIWAFAAISYRSRRSVLQDIPFVGLRGSIWPSSFFVTSLACLHLNEFRYTVISTIHPQR
jgi:hypothetical protein